MYLCAHISIIMKKSCPICQSTAFHSIFNCVDHFVSQETFEIIECNQCGMRITNDFPPENIIGRYYETQDYISHSDTKKGLVNNLYHQVRQRMLKKKAQWIEANSGIKKGKILDVGTGTGYFAFTMKKRGWMVDTIEQSTEAQEFAKKEFGLFAYPSLEKYASDKTDINNSLDVISLWHVLEHLEHLNESMKLFYKLLKPVGTLVLAVPNCNSYDARIYKNKWAAYDVPRHLWHFTPKQMEILAKNHGFILTEIKRMPFDAFYISLMSEKYSRSALPFFKGMFTGLCGYILSLFVKEKSSSLAYILLKSEK